MKRFLFFIIIFIIALCPNTDAALGSFGLIIEGGKDKIELQKGEEEWLFVQDGFTKLPCFHGLTFFSDNVFVASVGRHNGLLRANSYGSANIHVIDDKGENGVILVKVTSTTEKPSFVFLLFLLISLFGSIYIIIKR